PMLNPHIVSPRLSPRRAHRESPPRRLRHKLQLHPLPALLISPKPLPSLHPEILSMSHTCLSFRPEPERTRRRREESAFCPLDAPPKRKGAAHRPRLLFLKL